MIFSGQYPDEKIILIQRRHKIVLLLKIIFIIIWGGGSLLFFVITTRIFADFLWNYPYHYLLWLGIIVYLLFIWLYFLLVWTDYYLDVWIVTDKRIINIELKSLFARTVSEQKLYRIQDVTSELKGFFSTILDFGTVYVQTAGEKERFIFKQIPNPYGVARKILKIVEQNKKFQRLMEKEDKVSTK